MNPIDDVVQWIMSESDRTLDENMVRNATHWFFSIITNRKNKYINISMNHIPMNYFGIVCAGSNSGKGYISKKLLSLINSRKYEQMLISANHAFLPHDQISPKYVNLIAAINAESTTQGIHKLAEVFTFTGNPDNPHVGSLNFLNNEFFKTKSQSIMAQLLEGYDGNFMKPAIRGNADTHEYTDVSGIIVNLIGFSSIKPLLDDEKEFLYFKTIMDTGWFRRTWMTTDRTMRLRVKRPEPYELQESTMGYINNGDISRDAYLLEPHELHLDDEAKDMLYDLHRKFIEEPEINDMYSDFRDAYKVVRLAGIRASSERRETILKDDMTYAIDFERSCHRDASYMLSLRNTFVRVYDRMKKGPVTIVDMKTEAIIPNSMRKNQFDGLMEEVEIYAKNHSGSLSYKDDIYTLNMLHENKGNVSFAWSKNQYSMYENITGAFNDKLVNWMNGKSITPWTFNKEPESDDFDTNRSKENAIESYMVCFDFERQINKDTGEVFEMSVSNAEEIFEEYEYILRTSKSHMKNDKGNRFHIYIPYKFVMELQADEYRETYFNLAKKFGILDFIDRTTSHRASLFNEAENPIIAYYHDGIRLDYRCCIPDTKEADDIEKNHLTVQTAQFKSFRLKSYLLKVMADITKGNRDNATNSFVYAAKTKIGASSDEIREALDLLKNVIQFDSSFKERDFDKFYKRI